ncbi:DUF1758 domain-containing protein [Trichonephila clavipes]|nr:DUF1758 domain-containing protein [Trichonephila clavipes]
MGRTNPAGKKTVADEVRSLMKKLPCKLQYDWSRPINAESGRGNRLGRSGNQKSYNELSDNYPLAKQRFQNLWRRFGHDSELYQQYREIIRDYTEQGIIEEVKTEITDNKLKRPVYYLPHQAIKKKVA